MTVRLAANLIPNTLFGHLQLVRNNIELEVQAPGDVFLGDWVVSPLLQSHSDNTPNYQQRHQYKSIPIDFKEVTPADAWNTLGKLRNAFAEQEITYDINQNSNSYINTLLDMVGISLSFYLDSVKPFVVLGFPGAKTNVMVNDEAFSIDIELNDGNNFLKTGNDNDIVLGLGGNDTIATLDGNDILDGGAGDDILDGGNGNDTIDGGNGNDTIDGGEGRDTIDYSKVETNLIVTLPSKKENINGVNTYVGIVEDDAQEKKHKFFNIEKLILSPQSEELVLSPETISNLNIDIDANNKVPGTTNQGGNKDILNLEAFGEGLESKNGQLFYAETQTPLNPDLSLKNFEIFKYGDGDDLIYPAIGETKFHEIDTGDGDDTIAGAVYGSRIETGAGNDVVVIGNNIQYEDLLYEDRLRVVHDGNELTGGFKHVALDTPYVTDGNGIKYAPNNFGELVIENPAGDRTFISNSSNAPDDKTPTANIALGEITIESFRIFDSSIPSDWYEQSIEAAYFMYRARNGVEYDPASYDPLVLDLDEDGIELSPLSAVSPKFDLDNDGFAEGTGWVRRDDGLLVYDRNGNGTIDNVTELFGIGTTSGFTELQKLDSNENNEFDPGDEKYNEVGLWQDFNQNGISEANELSNLNSYGIVSISLEHELPDEDVEDWAVGNAIALVSTFVRNDGTSGTVADVRFAIDNYNTRYLKNVEITEDAIQLPEVKGFGILPNLRTAISETPSLLNTVGSILVNLNTRNLAQLRKDVRPILAQWGSENTNIIGQNFGGSRSDVLVFLYIDNNNEEQVWDFAIKNGESWQLNLGVVTDDEGEIIENPTREQVLETVPYEGGRWDVITGTEISFLERYFGQPMPLTSESEDISSSYTAETFIETLYTRLDEVTVRLAVQGELSNFFPAVTYDVTLDKFVPTSDEQLTPTFRAIFNAAPNSADTAESYFASWKEFLRVFIGGYDRQSEGAKNTYSFIVANLVAAYEEIGAAIGLVDIAEAIGVPEGIVFESITSEVEGTIEEDIFYIGRSESEGVRTLDGGKKHDAYVFGNNFGKVVIDDYEAPQDGIAPDMIRFARLSLADVTFFRDGVDLIISVNNTDDEVRVKNQFTSTHYSADDTGVEEISFADGTLLDSIGIARQTPKPSPLNETITGTKDLDVFDGGAGFDTYQDSGQGDIYRFGKDYGHDLIIENLDRVDVNQIDYVTFLEGITEENLRFEKEVDSNTLHIYHQNSNDILSIQNQYDFDTAVFSTLFKDMGFHEVEIFTFESGGYLYSSQILRTALAGMTNSANNFIDGTKNHDFLDGGAGNDYLRGKSGRDTYIFGKGYGFDYIEDTANLNLSYQDTLLFQPDVAPEDVIITAIETSSRGILDFIISFKDDSSQLRIHNQFYPPSPGATLNYIEYFQFQDAARTRWSREEVYQRVIDASGDYGYKIVEGTSGDDVLDAQPGMDYLKGGYGVDIYEYNLGDGADLIEDFGAFGEENTIRFGEGITPENVTLTRSAIASNFHITFKTETDSLTVLDNFEFGANRNYPDSIKKIEFSNGTVWDSAIIRQKISGFTEFNDNLIGFSSDDTLEGGKGDDYLSGHKGSDLYRFNLGDGHDVIDDNIFAFSEENDTLAFGEGITPESIYLTKIDADLLVRLKGHSDWLTIRDQFSTPYDKGIEKFVFSDGNQWDKEDIANILETTNNSFLVTTNNNSETSPLTLMGETAQIAYVAYYGRPADNGGKNYWNQVLNDNNISYSPRDGDWLTGNEAQAYNQIVNDFGNSDEANRIFGVLNNRDKVNTVYNFAFGRDGDAGGLDYWSDELEQGNVSLTTFALEVALGAQNQDVITLRNKIESADLFSGAIDTPAEVQAYSGNIAELSGRDWLRKFGLEIANQVDVDNALSDLIS